MKKYLCFFIFLLSFDVVALGAMTNIEPGITLYSEYYPNPDARMKGTIVFINGSGSDISVWKSKKLFDCAKKIGSVFLYDRNGLGKSPPDLHLSPDNPITAQSVSDRLSMLLKKRNIQPPYLFIAHSHGAMYASYFTLKNPALVKGVLLVDPMPKDCTFSPEAMNKLKKGVNDVQSKPADYIYKTYNKANAEAFYQIAGLDKTKQSIQQSGDIDNAIPVIILSSSQMEEQHACIKDWYESQKLWLNKNTLSTIIQVPSDHFIQLTKPQLVCDTLKHMLGSEAEIP
ncbi:alpha/beta hydrolase [uncultured Legionella sp.]|mgnify:CR=1 FL=1|uniref:alpha/beta fold hydrolase n=1 Tax=uncultured Legionella sp. TaxID=210934 RepID=UPI00260E6EE9|nr:alpha/beta hydrolase [uncultured Legionella sp.]